MNATARTLAIASGTIVTAYFWLGPTVAGLAIAMALGVPLHLCTLQRRDAPPGYWRIYFVALGWQLVHFAEEAAMGFAERWPVLFSEPQWTMAEFAGFNAVCYVAFALAPRWPRELGWFASFFLAAMFANGIGHVAAAIVTGGYFPGLVTAPGSFVIGVLLARRWRSSQRHFTGGSSTAPPR